MDKFGLGFWVMVLDCQTLSGPLPQSGSPAREARGAAAKLLPHSKIYLNLKMGRNARQVLE